MYVCVFVMSRWTASVILSIIWILLLSVRLTKYTHNFVLFLILPNLIYLFINVLSLNYVFDDVDFPVEQASLFLRFSAVGQRLLMNYLEWIKWDPIYKEIKVKLGLVVWIILRNHDESYLESQCLGDASESCMKLVHIGWNQQSWVSLNQPR